MYESGVVKNKFRYYNNVLYFISIFLIEANSFMSR